jgi:hypothetical protein
VDNKARLVDCMELNFKYGVKSGDCWNDIRDWYNGLGTKSRYLPMMLVDIKEWVGGLSEEKVNYYLNDNGEKE